MSKFLNTIVQRLTKEEIRFFKLFLNRTNAKNRKDVDLFDLMRKKRDDLNTDEALYKLKINSNNYYQIKNRLYNELNNSMIWQHIWKDNQSKSFSFVLLSRVYKNKCELELAFHYLLKAEKEAINSQLYEVLSIIYTEIIQLSHELISVEVDTYIDLKKQNLKTLNQIDEIDMLLAKVMHEFKKKQNFGKLDNELIVSISNKYSQSLENDNLIDKPRFRLKLFKMYSRILLEKRDYISLEVFLLKSYNSFISDNIFDRSNHNDKLTLLTYLSNCFYKTKKYKKSLEFANKLYLSMQEHDSLLFDKYLFYYYNALVLNYSKIDKDKALKFIDQASKNEIITSLPAYSAFIYLNRALIFYYKNNFKEAIKNLSRLTLLEDFLLLDKSFQLKILIVDVMMRWLNQANDILDRISEIKNGYKSILSNVELRREKDFINIISNSVNSIKIDDLKTQFLTSLSDSESEEIDIISYNSWLRNYLK